MVKDSEKFPPQMNNILIAQMDALKQKEKVKKVAKKVKKEKPPMK